jgi:hypothetical protein
MRIWVTESLRYDETNNTIISQNEEITSYEGIDIKVRIYRERVKKWFFGVAEGITKNGKSTGDYIALMVGIAYLEAVEQFRRGKLTPVKKSGEWFQASAKRVFPGHTEDLYKRIWKETRCGLFHMGFPNGKIYLTHDQETSFSEENEKLLIHPAIFLKQVENDFDSYIITIQNPLNVNERKKFEKLWDLLWNAS